MKYLDRGFLEVRYNRTFTDDEWLAILIRMEGEEVDNLTDDSYEDGYEYPLQIVDDIVENMEDYLDTVTYFAELSGEGWKQKALARLEGDLLPLSEA